MIAKIIIDRLVALKYCDKRCKYTRFGRIIDFMLHPLTMGIVVVILSGVISWMVYSIGGSNENTYSWQ